MSALRLVTLTSRKEEAAGGGLVGFCKENKTLLQHILRNALKTLYDVRHRPLSEVLDEG